MYKTSRQVSIERGMRGPLLSESTACAASNMAIGDALDAIRLGRAEVMVCGGTEAPVTPASVAGFAAMRALSTRNDDPGSASRPFDAERRRVCARGGRRHARARGARACAGAQRAGLRRARARGARACAGAQRAGLRRARRLRSLLRREPRLRPGSRRGERRARDADGARARQDRAQTGRLRQRARNLHARR
jgi:acetyl-CoA acetyltransferase